MQERREQGSRAYQRGLALGLLGTVGVAAAGGALAQALARCVGAGAALAGAQVCLHDGQCAGCARCMGTYYRWGASVFVRQEGAQTSWWITDGAGKALEPSPAPGDGAAGCTGEWVYLNGAERAWAAARSAGVHRRGWVSAHGPDALVLALERMGYTLVPPQGEIPHFQADQEGLRLEVFQAGARVCPPGGDALAQAAAYQAREAAWEGVEPVRRLI